MSRWKNYRLRQDAGKGKESDRKVQERIEKAARSASREAAYSGQKLEIEAAVSLANARGISTVGKVVGLQSISPGGGDGWTVPDIGIQESIEADEDSLGGDAPARKKTGSGGGSDASHSEQIIGTEIPQPEDDLEW